MSEGLDDNPRNAKLEGIRGRLMGDPTKDDLESMQLNLDVLERYDRVVALMMDSHHHHHMDDHDDIGP